MRASYSKWALCILLSLASSSHAQERWFDRKAEGFFWYQDPPQPQEPAEAQPEPAPEPAPEPNQPPQAKTKTAPKVLSVEWVQENLDKFRNDAIDNPTKENVQAYLYLQAYAAEKAKLFADKAEQYSIAVEGLDADINYPTATFAKYAKNYALADLQEAQLHALKDKIGLLVFYDDQVLSKSQASSMRSLQYSYHYALLEFAKDPSIAKALGVRSLKHDRGQSEALGISHFPAVVLSNDAGETMILSQSALSVDTMKYRIATAAMHLGVLSKSDYYEAWIGHQPVALDKIKTDQSTISKQELIELLKQ